MSIELGHINQYLSASIVPNVLSNVVNKYIMRETRLTCKTRTGLYVTRFHRARYKSFGFSRSHLHDKTGRLSTFVIASMLTFYIQYNAFAQSAHDTSAAELSHQFQLGIASTKIVKSSDNVNVF